MTAANSLSIYSSGQKIYRQSAELRTWGWGDKRQKTKGKRQKTKKKAIHTWASFKEVRILKMSIRKKDPPRKLKEIGCSSIIVDMGLFP